MCTTRPELSTKNKYYIDKHRYYELKHFCLQYKQWKKTYSVLQDIGLSKTNFSGLPSSGSLSDITATCAIRKAELAKKIKMIESAAIEADKDLWFYIIKAVTEGLSYTQLKMIYDIPCCRNTYYDRHRKFFWLLDQYRN